MLQFELKDGKKINISGHFKVEFDNYGDLTLIGGSLKRKSSSELLDQMGEKLSGNFYKENIAISQEKSEPISYEDIQKKKEYQNLMRNKFQEFITVWVTNFDIQGKDSPIESSFYKIQCHLMEKK